MSDPLSVGDAFTVGVSFDLLGGYLLGRGLLASPLDIARRNTRLWGAGFNASEAISQIKSGVDGRLGLVSLALGFLLQAGGYVALLAGASLETGGGRAVLAVVWMAVAAIVGWLILRRVHRQRVHRLAVDVARGNPASGVMEDHPDADTLVALGRAMGYPFAEVTPEGNVADVNAYAKRYFGVNRTSRRYPHDLPAPQGT
jgi:hypothetical protein